MRKKRVVVNDKMQKNYVYFRTEPVGKHFAPDFKPELTPKQMLRLGVFGGKYLTDCQKEFPKDWFVHARLSPQKHDVSMNFFEVDASLPLSEWKKKHWIYKEDPRGWFQWYCRYFMGRRCRDDERQIKRWNALHRHVKQLQKNCKKGDWTCRKKQRQALLHWAFDSRKL